MLRQFTVKGSDFEVGFGLGRMGADAAHRLLINHPLWAEVNAPRHAAAVYRMKENTKLAFPRIWSEVEGMAAGLELPVDEVFAWNCRGDLLSSSPDGCTTVLVPGPVKTIGHNEDGFPFLKSECGLAEVAPSSEPSLITFVYPASLPGHTFSLNGSGLVQTVNNIRLTNTRPEFPRMVLGRAVASCSDLDAATDIIRRHSSSGGFHFTLAQAGDPRLLSVEFGKGSAAVLEVTTPQAHANHALHAGSAFAGQIITESSHDRQIRAEALILDGADPLAILADTAGPGLPIYRDQPDDPDDENTIATLIAKVGPETVKWSVHTARAKTADFRGEIVARR